MRKKLAILSARTIRPLYERTSMHRRVIEEVSQPELREAYAYCRQVTREYAKTFYLATRFLPSHKQRAIFAIYAMCRHLDNIADGEQTASMAVSSKPEVSPVIKGDPVEADRLLHLWEEELRRTFSGVSSGGGTPRDHPVSDHPIHVALSDLLRRHDIPLSLPLQLIEGVRMDLVKNRYETFDELYEYSYKVASVVGLMIAEVFGYRDSIALPRAVDLGIAMQLTNILRDVGEDLHRDRIYLPAEEMRRFGVTEDDLRAHRITGEFIALMQFQISRARSYYQKSDPGIAMLSSDSRLPVYLARHNYARILDRIEASGYQVFSRRAHLTFSQKMAILPKAWWSQHTGRVRCGSGVIHNSDP